MKVIVFGGTGQDGSFLIDKLFANHEVICVHRPDRKISDKRDIRYVSLDLHDGTCQELIRLEKPDKIFNFAGVSNVFDPWSEVETVMSLNLLLPASILHAIKKYSPHTKFVQASSSLVFGQSFGPCDENTRRCPVTPYGISKNAADELIKEARELYNLNVGSAILFNHESERRGSQFFTKKVITAAIDFSRGMRNEPLLLGSLDAYRDMGFAWDYVDAIEKISNLNNIEDFVIGTGEIVCMRDIVRESFEHFSLDYKDFVIENCDPRRIQTPAVKANSKKILESVGWKAQKFSVHQLIDRILQCGEKDARTF